MTADPPRTDPGGRWREEADCLDHPAEWFTGPHEPGDTRRAIDVCTTCPVKQPCLDAALSIEVSADLGIWGGTTPATRRRLRRERAKPNSQIDVPSQGPEGPSLAGSSATQTSRVDLREDEHGDHIDPTGRIIVFEIHGEPRYMLMMDGKPRARTSTVADAAGLAARFMDAAVRAADRPSRDEPEQAATRHTATAPRRR